MNIEGYRDPTAEEAVGRVAKEERGLRKPVTIRSQWSAGS